MKKINILILMILIVCSFSFADTISYNQLETNNDYQYDFPAFTCQQFKANGTNINNITFQLRNVAFYGEINGSIRTMIVESVNNQVGNILYQENVNVFNMSILSSNYDYYSVILSSPYTNLVNNDTYFICLNISINYWEIEGEYFHQGRLEMATNMVGQPYELYSSSGGVYPPVSYLLNNGYVGIYSYYDSIKEPDNEITGFTIYSDNEMTSFVVVLAVLGIISILVPSIALYCGIGAFFCVIAIVLSIIL